MLNINYRRYFVGALLGLVFCTSTFAGNGDSRMFFMLPEQSDSVSKDSSSNQYNHLEIRNKTLDGVGMESIKVSGVTRFLTIYRSMQESYTDMLNSDKNFSFTDYPLANVGTNVNGGFPIMELNLESQFKSGFNFNVGYSIGHNFTGDVIESSSQSMSIRQNLNFRGTMRNDMVKTTIYAGEVLWSNLSRFTMGQPEYRDNYFERLPWDWYRESFQRYREYFSLSNNIGNEALGRSPIQGFIGEVSWLPMQINFKGIYGRTNRSITLANSLKGFPAYTHGYRIEKIVFERLARGSVGANFYQRNADSAAVGNITDRNTIGSIDFDLKIKKVKLVGEFGFSQVENGTVDQYDNTRDGKGFGNGFALKTEFDNRAVLWPFSIEVFQISQNLASLDGSIINSNTTIEDGGAANELIYDNMLFVNISNEAGQLANNRRGVNLKIEASLTKNLKAQFGYYASSELEANHDTLTIQHRVNSFSRSRFRPWFQAGGPYGRIKSFWLRTFETITIGNEIYNANGDEILQDRSNANVAREKLLGFNGLEFLLKYKTKIGKHELVLLNFNSINTVKFGFNAFPSSNPLITLWYEDFTAAFSINKKFSVVGNFAVEGVQGSEFIDLSPDKKDAAVEDRVISQLGTMSAIGFDYDFSRTTSFHWRTKYMTHRDVNFVNDKFSGLETTVELKIFF
jgi:hypothetical protein